MTSPHRLVNPDTLPPAVGYAHAVVAAPGRSVYIAGQVGQDADGRIEGTTICEQFEAATMNVVAAPEGLAERIVVLGVVRPVGDEDETAGDRGQVGTGLRADLRDRGADVERLFPDRVLAHEHAVLVERHETGQVQTVSRPNRVREVA